MCRKWDALADEEKASGEWINPDEPLVVSVPSQDTFDNENDNEYFHIMSHGGGSDVDEDGEDCGHDGAHLECMEIDQSAFLYNGRRLSSALQSSPAEKGGE
jgi:hypothetical protein